MSFMKGILVFLAVAVVLSGFGVCGWLIFQKSEELDQTNASNAILNVNLATTQGLLSQAQDKATAIQGQLDAERAGATALEIELAAQMTRIAALETELEGLYALVDDEDIAAELARLSAELAEANADLTRLMTESAATLTELAKIKNPRHFGTKEELKDWLEHDDTNTNPDYELLGPANRAFILQVKALRDGYILPAAIDADDDNIYVWNIAVIGTTVYVVNADTDEIFELAIFSDTLPVGPSEVIK